MIGFGGVTAEGSSFQQCLRKIGKGINRCSKRTIRLNLSNFCLRPIPPPPHWVSLAKRLLLAGILICISASAVAEEPHWIGLDTSIRDSQTWTAPVESTFSCSLDTLVSDFWASVSTVIRGMFITIR